MLMAFNPRNCFIIDPKEELNEDANYGAIRY